MFNQLQVEAAKNDFIEFLTDKVKDSSADTQKYIKNSLVLVMDDIMDVLNGNLNLIVFSKDKNALLKIDKDENIPFENIMWYDAMVAYAADKNITLSYDIVYGEYEHKVYLKAYSPIPIHHVSQRMEMTMTKEKIENWKAAQDEKAAAHQIKVDRFAATGEFVLVPNAITA